MKAGDKSGLGQGAALQFKTGGTKCFNLNPLPGVIMSKMITKNTDYYHLKKIQHFSVSVRKDKPHCVVA